jgi:hypothetical protein
VGLVAPVEVSTIGRHARDKIAEVSVTLAGTAILAGLLVVAFFGGLAVGVALTLDRLSAEEQPGRLNP